MRGEIFGKEKEERGERKGGDMHLSKNKEKKRISSTLTKQSYLNCKKNTKQLRT